MHRDDNLKTVRTEIYNVVYRRNKNLKELLTLSPFPILKREKYAFVTSCNKCDICKNYMFIRSTFVRTVTGKRHYIRDNFTCSSTNVIYPFKQHFCIHKPDIKTKKDRFGIASHFNSTCCSPINPCDYLKVQPIEQILCDANKDTESILWEREKYWQFKSITNTKTHL